MSAKYDKAKIHVWTPLIGFEKEDSDRGAERMLSKMPFVPDGISAFLFHMDIIMQHDGMAREITLPPDMCSYAGSDRNGERDRQEWSNFALRDLLAELKKKGTETYLSIMANMLNNKFHNEWIYEHPEIIYDAKIEKGAPNVMRRFKDGTFFEDFFIDKLCQTLLDYEFDGFYPTDLFCPMCWRISMGDYSSDMLEQFSQQTGIGLPQDILSGMGDDSNENKCRRGEWLWKEHRADWIQFYAWRWGVFWKKLCTRLHAIGKKVISLGVYCTDPFENLYCMGIDLKVLYEAGIDALVPNIVPTGMRLQHPDWRDPFFNYMNMLPLISAYVPEQKLYTMLGVRDDTEEWDLIHHVPTNLERDIYMMTGFMRVTPEGMKHCTDGFMVCLGDSLRKEDWEWLKERFDIGFYEGAEETGSPVLIWSDAAFHAMLPSYIETRRWTHHKYAYEMNQRGTLMGAVARMEDLECAKGTLFVPNFDLLPASEKKMIADYKNGAVICTAMKGFVPEEHGISPDIYLEDKFSKYPACAFAFGCSLEESVRTEIEALCNEDDGVPNLEGDAKDIPEYEFTILRETLKFSKVTKGFADAVALLLRKTGKEMFTSNLPITVTKTEAGRYRIMILNPSLTSYGYAVVSCKDVIKSAKSIGKYPLLPLKYMNTPTDRVSFLSSIQDGTKKHFRVKVTPGGMAIIEVEI